MHTTFSIESNRAAHTFDNTSDHRAYIAIAALGNIDSMHNFLSLATEITAETIAHFSKKKIKFLAKVGTLQGFAQTSHSGRMVQIAGASDSGERNCPFATILYGEKIQNPNLYVHIFCFPLAPISLQEFNAAEAEAKASNFCENVFNIVPTNKAAHFSKSSGYTKRKTPMKFHSNPFE